MTTGGSSDDDKNDPAEIVPFPYSRVKPNRTADVESATYGTLAREIGIPIEQTTGHWCSYCQKIWFGYLLEVTCPTCGSRQG
jgi:Zn finger protein HypA/HybF involved in hydrogenase expression